MKTTIIKINDTARDSARIEQIAEALKAGGLAALPTETVYGIAANALDADAVARIFKVKGRPADNPLIVHVASLEDITPLVNSFPQEAERLAARFWPGPLTIVLPKTALVPDIVSAKLDTVAVRMPSHPVIRAVIRACGLPLAAPSANLSGRPSPTNAKHCIEDLNGKVELIVDGGDCEVGLESTVISLAGERPRLLRPGLCSLEDLQEVLPDITVDPSIVSGLAEGAKASSPGMKYKHYAPDVKIKLIHGSFPEFCRFVAKKPAAAALVFDGEEKRLSVPCVTYGASDDPARQARRLFAALRELEELGADIVYARAPEQYGAGLAVYNRLLRAAGFDEIYL
jgi:L-threonylcarbamoyladenylate synthase